MKKVIVALIILIAAGLVTYYTVFNKPANTADNSGAYAPQAQDQTPAVNPATGADQATEVAVDIKDFKFSPATLNIKAGTKVTWTNKDTAPHTVTSDSGTLLNSPSLSTGESWSFTFNDAGTVSYHCKIHTMMKASVVVTK